MGCWESLYHAMGMVLAVKTREEEVSGPLYEAKVGTHHLCVHMGDALWFIRYRHTMKCVLPLDISSFCAVGAVLFHLVELRFHVSRNIFAQSSADVGDACAGIHDVNIAACLTNSLDGVYQFGGDGLHLVLLFFCQ